MRHADREELAAEMLSAFEDRFEYEDRRRFDGGRYEEIAERLERNARHQYRLGIVTSVVFVVFAAFFFVEYGAEGDVLSLLLGGAHAVMALAALEWWTRTSTHIRTSAAQVLTLLEQREAPVREDAGSALRQASV